MEPESPEPVDIITPKVRRVDLYPDEWIAGQVGLANAERGLYLTACLLIYSHGGSISIEDLKASCRDHGHAFKCQLDRLLSLGKLALNDGQITNKRCAKEIQKVLKRISNGPRNGVKGGRPRKENNELENQTGSSTINLNQQPSNQQPATNPTEEPLPAEVVPFPAREMRANSHAFEGEFIRLDHHDFDRWRKAFPDIPNLMAELTCIDAWFRDHPEKAKTWFPATAGMLAKKNQEMAEIPADLRRKLQEQRIWDLKVSLGEAG